MDSIHNKFGKGPREFTGAMDLISYFKLFPYHNFFCKTSFPVSLSDTHYLHNVVGEAEIRKGEGMQLGQLIQDKYLPTETDACLQPFELHILRDAFPLRETNPIDLPPSEGGIPTTVGKSKSESKNGDRKHKKHKHRDKDKDKEPQKDKHLHNAQSKDRDAEKRKEKSGHHDSNNDHSKSCHEKKRKLGGDEDRNGIQKPKKNKIQGNTSGRLSNIQLYLALSL